MLVELACSCVLAPIYHSKRILNKLLSRQNTESDEPIVMVVIVCGGNKINTEMIEQYRLQSEKEVGIKDDKVTLDGQSI